MTAAAQRAGRTPADWLDWEERQVERWEMVGSEPTMMAGGSARHNDLAGNCYAALRQRLRGGRCHPQVSDVKVALPNGRWAYPDVFVRCGARTGRETIFDDPVVVIEVLSPGTASYDLDERRWAYEDLASLRHLLLVAQDRAAVEVASRGDDGSWRSVYYTGLDRAAPLDAVGIELPLAAIYQDIILDPEAAVA